MSINDNHVDVARYRGEVRACEFCKNSILPAPLRTHCKFCLTNGWVAKCLSCDGTGNVGATDPWGSGVVQKSTCGICGGSGVLPAKEPPKTAIPKVLSGNAASVKESAKEDEKKSPTEQVAV